MKDRSKKILSSGTALLCVLAILVSGTLAFLGSSVATNSFRDTIIPLTDLTGANLHDDFAGMQGVNGDMITDKDVYVENTGDKDVFVRIKLTEVFDGTSQLFIPKIDGEGAIEAAGNTAGFEWKLGGNGPKNYNSIKDTTQWDNALAPGAQTGLVADAIGQATTASKADTSVGTPAGQTLDKDGVISMTQYFAMHTTDRAAFQGWIYDVDGFAYWSQPLEPDTATGLLLDSVRVPEVGKQTYEYDIVVDMEFVDMDDIPAWLDAGADGARTVVVNADKQWDGVLTNAAGATIQAGPKAGTTTTEATAEAKQALVAITKFNNQTLTASATTVNITSDAVGVAGPSITDGEGNPAVIVSWSSSNTSAVVVAADGKLTAAGLTGSSIITGTDRYGNTVTFTVVVSQVYPSGVPTPQVRTLSHLQTGDGKWIELAQSGQYSLIVKSDIVRTSRFSNTSNFIAYSDLNTTTVTNNLRYAMNNWYSEELDANARLRSHVVGHDALAKLGIWGELSTTSGFSAPTGVAPAAGATDVAFPLSFQEAATYLSLQWLGSSSYIPSSAEAIANWGELTRASFWLRSPSFDTIHAAYLDSGGNLSANNVRNAHGMRPALWVRTSIFVQ